MQTEKLYEIYKKYPLVSTDTREIKSGSIFFALKGSNFNGNEFADKALNMGAKYVVIDQKEYVKDSRYILVDNVLNALQDLALFHRNQLVIPVVGVTGTNGKTTSKELLFSVLSQKFKTFATKGNLNNHIGVPLSLLSINSSYQVAIIEMGANHVGEIKFLSQIAKPTHGLITNVGKAHLEGFGSFEGVKKAKGELYDFLADNNGKLFLQGDNEDLVEMAGGRKFSKIIKYGFSSFNDIIGELLIANPYLSISWKLKQSLQNYKISTHLTGSYNTENFLAAIAVGIEFGVNSQLINKGLSAYVPQNNRSQITKTLKNTIVADFYNANVSSMTAALDNMRVLSVDKKIVILGDMFELGNESYKEHAYVIQKAKSLELERLIFVGKEFYKHKDDKLEFYETTQQAAEALKAINGGFILLKASRGMLFEKLLEVL